MICQVLGVIGVLAVVVLVVWSGMRIADFIPDIIGAVKFYRKHKNDYGDDKVTNLETTQDKIIKALSEHLNLHMYNSCSTSYYGPNMVKLSQHEAELYELIKERIDKKQKKWEKEQKEKRANIRRKK